MHEHTVSRRLAVRRVMEVALPGKPVRVPPHEALGLVVAEAGAAECDVPEGASSLRDGYALRSADLADASGASPVRLETGQTIHAESTMGNEVRPGHCARVLTGGLVPPGADAVLAEEDVTEEVGHVLATTPVRPGWAVRAAGEDIRRGAIVCPAGEIVSPQTAAVMARTRVAALTVFPRPSAAVLALGSELSNPACAATPCDAARFPADNLVLLGGLLERAGAAVQDGHVLPDAEELLVQALSADGLPDLMITTGGTGRSERDFARSGALAAGFELLFDHVDIRPCWNMFAAHRDGTLLFGLPGPPPAGFACFHAVILPAVRRLRGLPSRGEATVVRMTEGLSAKPGGDWLVPCELRRQGSVVEATPLHREPSMAAMARAQGMIVIASGESVLSGGDAEILVISDD